MNICLLQLLPIDNQISIHTREHQNEKVPRFSVNLNWHPHLLNKTPMQIVQFNTERSTCSTFLLVLVTTKIILDASWALLSHSSFSSLDLPCSRYRGPVKAFTTRARTIRTNAGSNAHKRTIDTPVDSACDAISSPQSRRHRTQFFAANTDRNQQGWFEVSARQITTWTLHSEPQTSPMVPLESFVRIPILPKWTNFLLKGIRAAPGLQNSGTLKLSKDSPTFKLTSNSRWWQNI